MNQVLLQPDGLKLSVELPPVALKGICPHSVVREYLGMHQGLIDLPFMLGVWPLGNSFWLWLGLFCGLLC